MKSVEWYSNGAVAGIRFTLSDGSESKMIGAIGEQGNKIEFPDRRPIKSVKVRADANWVYQLEF